MTDKDELRAVYVRMKNACRCGWSSKDAGDAILDLALFSLRFLESESDFVELISRVPGNQYVSYIRGGIAARPANRKYFLRNADEVSEWWRAWENNTIEDDRLANVSYTVALAPCLAMELFDRQNKKGPATYFEHLVGHIFAKALGEDPKKCVSLPVHGQSVRITMDFLFDLGSGKSSIHLPVKMSTRERVVQAWSHQRLLDCAYGESSYKGVMVVFSETKMDSRSLEVVEICVPDQWLAYQTLLAKLDKIYYFDVPERYQALTDSFPNIIEIRQFGQFFSQIDSIAR